jgi:hypothetical protein
MAAIVVLPAVVSALVGFAAGYGYNWSSSLATSVSEPPIAPSDINVINGCSASASTPAPVSVPDATDFGCSTHTTAKDDVQNLNERNRIKSLLLAGLASRSASLKSVDTQAKRDSFALTGHERVMKELTRATIKPSLKKAPAKISCATTNANSTSIILLNAKQKLRKCTSNVLLR